MKMYLLKSQEVIQMKNNSKVQTNSPQTYGYVRISDSSQKIHRQMDFMKSLSIPQCNIFIDQQSGKNFNRPAYKKLCRQLQPGDTLYVKELDRLGRNKVEIKEELSKLRKKNIRIKITNIPTTMHDYGEDDWILDMVNNILIEVLAAVAEQERAANHQRQAEGIAAAKARGVHMGRPYLHLPDNFSYYYQAWEKKEIPRADILKELNIDMVKFQSYVRSYKSQLKKGKIQPD